MENVKVLLMVVGFATLVGLTAGWGLIMQRRALQKQSKAMSAVDESLAMSRESLELSRKNAGLLLRMVELAEQSNRQQAEMIELLRRQHEPKTTIPVPSDRTNCEVS